MNNGFYYQLLASLSRENNRFNYPRYLKDMVRTGDLDDVKEVEAIFADEIAEGSLHDDNGADYFVHMAETGLLFSIYREDFDRFFQTLELVEKRLMQLRSSGAARIDVRGWLWYLGYLAQSARRLQRTITIEEFEREIDEIEWDELDEDFIHRVSGVSGFVYLNEEEPDKFNKSRFWLQRATHGMDMAGILGFYMNLADYYLSDPNSSDNKKRIEAHIKELEDQANSVVDPNLARLYRSAVLELQARALIFSYGSYDDDHIKVEENLRSVRAIEKKMDYDGKKFAGLRACFPENGLQQILPQPDRRRPRQRRDRRSAGDVHGRYQRGHEHCPPDEGRGPQRAFAPALAGRCR